MAKTTRKARPLPHWADALNHALYPDRKGKKAPTISVWRDAEHSSYVEIPMMKAR